MMAMALAMEYQQLQYTSTQLPQLSLYTEVYSHNHSHVPQLSLYPEVYSHKHNHYPNCPSTTTASHRQQHPPLHPPRGPKNNIWHIHQQIYPTHRRTRAALHGANAARRGARKAHPWCVFVVVPLFSRGGRLSWVGDNLPCGFVVCESMLLSS